MGVALHAAAQLDERRWQAWDREELEAALDLSEALREHAVARAEQAEGELEAFRRLEAKRAVRRRTWLP